MSDCSTTEDGLLFKVVSNGREYRIFASGEVAGFDEPTIIVNYVDHWIADAVQCYARQKVKRAEPEEL